MMTLKSPTIGRLASLYLKMVTKVHLFSTNSCNHFATGSSENSLNRELYDDTAKHMKKKCFDFSI